MTSPDGIVFLALPVHVDSESKNVNEVAIETVCQETQSQPIWYKTDKFEQEVVID